MNIIVFSKEPDLLILFVLDDKGVLVFDSIEPPVLLNFIFDSLFELVFEFHSFIAINLNDRDVIARVYDGLDLEDIVWIFDCHWRWRWRWLWWFDKGGDIWQDLFDWERPLPEDANGAPEAPSVHTDEAESFEGHGLVVVVDVGIHELVGWNPLGEGAGVLPHVEVVLCLLTSVFVSVLASCGVHVAAIEEGATCGFVGEHLDFLANGASALTSIWILGHELWWHHNECRCEGLTQSLFLLLELGMFVVCVGSRHG